jgi:hypothetical protein
MSGKRQPHALAQYINVSGFQPRRKAICRCGWQSEEHWRRDIVFEQFKQHKREAKQ